MKSVEAKVVDPAVQVVGTVTYDTGTNAGFFPDGPALNRIVGNRFNTALGGPLLGTGMVTMVTVFPANAGAAQYVSLGTAPVAGNLTILDFVAATLTAGTFQQVAFPNVSVGPDFVAMFMGGFGVNQPAGLVGMSDMAVNGQGYHAIAANYTSLSMATGAAVVPNRNAMVRATGNILTPVELMDFRIQ